MLKKLLPIVLALVIGAVPAAKSVAIYHGLVQVSSGNPMSYSINANTTATGLFNSAAPALGAAGTTTIDPDFGAKVMRVTQGGSCAQSASGSFQRNNGTGWTPTINGNETALLMAGPAGWFLVQPIAVSGSTMSLNGACVQYPWSSGNQSLEFSSIHPNSILGLHSGYLTGWDYTTGITTNLFHVSTMEYRVTLKASAI